jgi:hypothetical protein
MLHAQGLPRKKTVDLIGVLDRLAAPVTYVKSIDSEVLKNILAEEDEKLRFGQFSLYS